jgi:5-methylcytosine-specific restriction endonuclease McrA
MAKFKGAILQCKECGIDFKVPQVRKNTAKYCSKECADIHRHDTTRMDKVEKHCLKCGAVFYERKCHSSRRKYCSYECANQVFSEFWYQMSQGDDRHFYTRTFWKKLRSLILERDEHKCQKCGNKEKLNVHHIQEKRNNGTEDFDNLIVLCSSCHRKTHRHYDYLRSKQLMNDNQNLRTELV